MKPVRNMNQLFLTMAGFFFPLKNSFLKLVKLKNGKINFIHGVETVLYMSIFT